MPQELSQVKLHQLVERRFKELVDAFLEREQVRGALLYGENQVFLVALDPERRLKARLGFVERPLSERERSATGAIPRIPSWIAECSQPRTTFGETAEKIKAAFEAGVKCVWIIEPWSQTVEEHRPTQPVKMLRRQAALSFADSCPGLSITVDDLFAGIPTEEPAEKLWLDCLHEKHECYQTGYLEVRECLIGDEKVRYRIQDSLPFFQQVMGAVRGQLLFLCGVTDEDYDAKPCGAMLVGRRAEDGIYDVHVWHELYPWACEHLGIVKN